MKKSQVVVTAALVSTMALSAMATPFVPLASAVEQTSSALVADVEALAKTQADIQNLVTEIKNLDGYKAYEEFNAKSTEKQQGANYSNLASVRSAVNAYLESKGGEAVENGNMTVAVAIEGLEKSDERVQKAIQLRGLLAEAEKDGDDQMDVLKEVQQIAKDSFGIEIANSDIMGYQSDKAGFKDKVIGKAGAEIIGKELREVSWVISQNKATTEGLLAERDQIDELLNLYIGMGGQREDIAANRIDAIVDEVKTEATYKNYTRLDSAFAKADRDANNLANQENKVKNSYNGLVKLAQEAAGADVSNDEKDARQALEAVKNLDGYQAYQAYGELSKNIPATQASYGANAATIAGNLSTFLNKTVAADDVSVAKAIETAKQNPEMEKALRFVHAYQNATTQQAIDELAALATELYGVEFTEDDLLISAADVMNKVQPTAPNTIAAATDIYNNTATTSSILAEDGLREEMISLFEKMGGTRDEATNGGVTSTLSGINWTIKNSARYAKYGELDAKVASTDGFLNKIAELENGFDATYNNLSELATKATGEKIEDIQKPTPSDPVYTERELKDDATGITVKGKFLEGYRLLVSENPYRIEQDNTNQAFYDIEVIDLDGKPVTLSEAINGPITVSMPLPAVMNAANPIDVMHIAFSDDGQTITGSILPATIENGTVTFTTTHFSLYGIVEHLPNQGDNNGSNGPISDGIGGITLAGQQTILRTEDGVYELNVIAPDTGATSKTAQTAVASVATTGVVSVLGAVIVAVKRFARRKH